MGDDFNEKEVHDTSPHNSQHFEIHHSTAHNSSERSEIKKTESFLKKNWPYLLLAALLIFGFYLRAYHIDYPVIGYHDMKETHYLTEARNFEKDGFFANGFFVPSWDYQKIKFKPTGIHSDTFPTGPIIVGAAFKIFGESLVLARGINILFALSSVVAFYFIIRKLFGRQDLAIVSAAIMSFNPLLVFFGRQVELINVALFLCLLGSIYYLKWLDKPSSLNMALFSVFLALGILTKYTFVLFAIPLALMFPFKKYLPFKSGIAKSHAMALKSEIMTAKAGWTILVLSLIACLGWLAYIPKAAGGNIASQFAVIDLKVIFSSQFWTTMKYFANDNYTYIGLVFAILGAIAFFASLKKNIEKPGYKYFALYFIGAIPWFLVAATKLQGHSYHQYPLLPLMVFFMAYFFVAISNGLSKMIGANAAKITKVVIILILIAISILILILLVILYNQYFILILLYIILSLIVLIIAYSMLGANASKIAKIIIILILLIILYLPSISAQNRMFDTQFYGLDVAGQYIKEHKSPGERVIHSDIQAFGLLWHADAKGTYEIPETVDNITYAEQNLNASWIFIYNWDFPWLFTDSRGRWAYISGNYSLKQFGFLGQGQQIQPIYLLLKKGGSFDITQLNNMSQGKTVKTKNYELTGGNVVFNYINF